MKTLLKLLPVLLILGCASIERTRDKLGPDGKVIARESIKAKATLMKGAIENFTTSTTDGDYKHTASAKGVQGAGDAEMVKAIAEGFSKVASSVAAAMATGGASTLIAPVTANTRGMPWPPPPPVTPLNVPPAPEGSGGGIIAQ